MFDFQVLSRDEPSQEMTPHIRVVGRLSWITGQRIRPGRRSSGYLLTSDSDRVQSRPFTVRRDRAELYGFTTDSIAPSWSYRNITVPFSFRTKTSIQDVLDSHSCLLQDVCHCYLLGLDGTGC